MHLPKINKTYCNNKSRQTDVTVAFNGLFCAIFCYGKLRCYFFSGMLGSGISSPRVYTW